MALAQTTDTCTDNHATFSPLLSNASKVTLSEGNMRGATSTSSGHVGLILSGGEMTVGLTATAQIILQQLRVR
jgi:hypothetical protein